MDNTSCRPGLRGVLRGIRFAAVKPYACLAMVLTVVTICSTPAADADPVTDLTSFTAGTTAKADEVNGNFSEVADSVNDNDARIGALQSEVDSLHTDIEEQPGRLLDVQVVEAFEGVATDDQVDRVSLTVECPNGYTVLGGGAGPTFLVGGDDWVLRTSRPATAGSGSFVNDGWVAAFLTLDGNDAVGDYGFSVKAICASIS